VLLAFVSCNFLVQARGCRFPFVGVYTAKFAMRSRAICRIRNEEQQALGTPIFAKEKPRNVEHEPRRCVTRPGKDRTMEYLILVAVASMMALYALIIIECSKNPEW
jgi:hypothetical protein